MELYDIHVCIEDQLCVCVHAHPHTDEACTLCENGVRNTCKNPKSLQVVQAQSVCVCTCICVLCVLCVYVCVMIMVHRLFI